MSGEPSCIRKFGSRIEPKAWPAAAGVICTIRCLHFIAKIQPRPNDKSHLVCKGVTLLKWW
jgi:hypothetical protein